MHCPILTSILFLLLLSPLPAFPAVTVSGDMSSFSYLPSSNPHFVDKDLIVPEGKTVTVPKGCIFLFSPFAGIKVNGTLIVLGAADTPVVFTSINDSAYNKNSMRPAEPFDWNGIIIGPTSHGSKLWHCVIGYSVYGIKSQIHDLSIDNGLFRSNGQFHFTIKDSILDVKDNRPFSYGENGTNVLTEPSSSSEVKTPATPPTIPAAPPVKSSPTFYKSKPFRIAAIGIGVLGAGAGIYYTVNAQRHLSVLEDISSGRASRDKSRWNTELDLKRGYVKKCSAAFVAGALGLAGFTVSFPLPDRIRIRK